MKSTKYNELIRDKIPDIIKASVKTPVIEALADSEYIMMLNCKLQEEVKENLSKIIAQLNERLGTNFTEMDKILGEVIKWDWISTPVRCQDTIRETGKLLLNNLRKNKAFLIR